MKLKKSISFISIVTSVTLVLSGCSSNKKDKYPIDKDNTLESKVQTSNVHYEQDTKGEKSNVVASAITDKKVLSITIEGLGNEESLKKLLEELDKFNIKATFFVSGIKVAEEPELARQIVQRGHELGNATLTGTNLTEVNYTKKITEIKRSHEEIKKYTGIDTKYIRPGHIAIDEEVKLAAKQCGYENIITYNINPESWDGKNDEEVSNYIDEKKERGGIVTLTLDKDPNIYKSIELIYNKLSEKSFEIIPLSEMMKIYEDRKENQYTLPKDWYKKNKGDGEFEVVESGSRNKKEIALTFDDWASDDTVDSILDTLDKYNIKATFFLRAKGVEQNPSLAYAISQRGHEIASHTYNHVAFDLLSKEEIKEDIMKAHEVIANAINKEPKRYLRPPKGVITDEAAKAIKECGYDKVIMYGPSALDWKVEHDAEYITNYMLNKTKNGDIILLHILNDINTPEALPKILEGLKNRGYTFTTVSEIVE